MWNYQLWALKQKVSSIWFQLDAHKKMVSVSKNDPGFKNKRNGNTFLVFRDKMHDIHVLSYWMIKTSFENINPHEISIVKFHFKFWKNVWELKCNSFQSFVYETLLFLYTGIYLYYLISTPLTCHLMRHHNFTFPRGFHLKNLLSHQLVLT